MKNILQIYVITKFEFSLLAALCCVICLFKIAYEYEIHLFTFIRSDQS